MKNSVFDVSYDDKYKKDLIRAFRISGLSKNKFSKEFGISRPTMNKWLKEYGFM